MTDVPDTFEAYAADRDGAHFTDWLRDRSEPDRTGPERRGRRAARPRTRRRLDALFRRTVELERAFFEVPYGSDGD